MQFTKRKLSKGYCFMTNLKQHQVTMDIVLTRLDCEDFQGNRPLPNLYHISVGVSESRYISALGKN